MITITIEDGKTVQKILHDTDRSLLETFIKSGMGTGSFCKGLSLCGRCRIRFLKGAPLPNVEERNYFEASALRRVSARLQGEAEEGLHGKALF